MRLTVAGFPVRIHPSFLLIAVFLGAGGGGDLSLVIAWVFVAGVSILLHELGHAFTFRLFGVDSRIEMHAMGGVTIPVSGRGLRAGQQVVVSAAGPLTGLAVGVGLYAVLRLTGYQSHPGSFADDIVRDILFANIVWSLVNLLPVYPLDGGQLLGGVLRLITRGGGEVATQVISFVTVVVVGIVALDNGYTIAAALLFWFWFLGFRDAAARRGAQRRVEQPPPRPDPEAVLRAALAQYAASPNDETGARLVAAYVYAGRLDDAVSLVEGPQSAHLGPLSRQVLDQALRASGRAAGATADGEPMSSPSP